MEKIKTLKDIVRHDKENWITEKRLKQEAIKWIKEIQKDRNEIINPIWFIRKFFNISEDDLK